LKNIAAQKREKPKGWETNFALGGGKIDPVLKTSLDSKKRARQQQGGPRGKKGERPMPKGEKYCRPGEPIQLELFRRNKEKSEKTQGPG